MESSVATIKMRFEAFLNNDPFAIYNLYSENSDFRLLFPTFDDYLERFMDRYAKSIPIKLEIIKVNEKSNLSQILYEERFIDIDEGEVIYYTKTSLKRENNNWKIIKEQREKRVREG
ncbi:MAG: hypothetical protein LDL13_02990 [Calditerrivibrio sp.]|nr:hypothetical protein [Calditerrivibrio sp.]MCA1932527.1 hypothetical protein [Calditerrivibrio sp.]MCA1981013.1 hypothetical protein [Calditerrivibrio sp.]